MLIADRALSLSEPTGWAIELLLDALDCLLASGLPLPFQVPLRPCDPANGEVYPYRLS